MRSAFSSVAFFVFACSAQAGEVERDTKIAEIFAAQGLSQQIEQQLEQFRGDAMERIAKSIFDKAISDRPSVVGIKKQDVEEVLVRFVKRNASMLTADNLIKVAAGQYGKELTDSDLDAILAYYKSPVGKKDVSATLRTVSSLSETILKTFDDKLAESVAAMESELDNLVEK